MADGTTASMKSETDRHRKVCDARESSAPMTPDPSAARRTSAGRESYVLVVDDVEDNRYLYASYLEHAGLRVEQACDGEQALEKIAREAPAVVIMDLGMPNLDGWEATRLIKTNPDTARIVVIVLTGFATRDDLLRARAAGADDVRTKPCLPRELLPLVQKHLDA